jgi:hypothetical protein
MEGSPPTRHWFHIPIQVICAAFCLYWYWHAPAPNKAVLCLGGVAALMALVEMRPVHKAIYFLLIVVLMFVENRAIDKDRADFARDEAYRRREENQKFTEVGTTITTNIQKLLDRSDLQFSKTTAQQALQFDATMSQFHLNVNEVTGGHSFAVVAPALISVGTSGSFPLMLGVRGTALMDVMVEVRRLPIPDEGSLTDIASYLNGVNVGHENIGTLSHATGIFLAYKISDLKQNEVNQWSINVFARNRPTHENLKVRWNASIKRWEYSFVVTETRHIKGKGHEYRVLEKTKPEWQSTRLLPPVK